MLENKLGWIAMLNYIIQYKIEQIKVYFRFHLFLKSMIKHDERYSVRHL